MAQFSAMTSITFKVSDADAQALRRKARAAKTSLSELLRQRLQLKEASAEKIKLTRCQFTGAEIFAPVAGAPALTTQSVGEMLSDFP